MPDTLDSILEELRKAGNPHDSIYPEHKRREEYIISQARKKIEMLVLSEMEIKIIIREEGVNWKKCGETTHKLTTKEEFIAQSIHNSMLKKLND